MRKFKRIKKVYIVTKFSTLYMSIKGYILRLYKHNFNCYYFLMFEKSAFILLFEQSFSLVVDYQKLKHKI